MSPQYVGQVLDNEKETQAEAPAVGQHMCTLPFANVKDVVFSVLCVHAEAQVCIPVWFLTNLLKKLEYLI